LGAASAVDLPDLREIQRDTLRIERYSTEVEDVHRRALDRLGALENRLADEEIHLQTAAVDSEMLRAARLDLDSMQSRLAVLEGRLEHRTLEQARLDTLIRELEDDLAESDRLDTERLRTEAGLELLVAKRAAMASILESIRELIVATRRHEDLLVQRLRLLQSRLSLATLDGATAQVEDQRVAMLQLVIGDFLARAVRNDRAAEAISGTGPRETERRRAIAMKADDAVTRGFLRQNDLELVLAENRLDSLGALRDDTTMPLRILEGAQLKLDEIEGILDRVDASLTAQRGVMESKLAALERGLSTEGSEIDMMRDLRSLIVFQGQDIETLRQRIAQERTTFDRVIGEARTGALFEHRAIPSGASDWRRVATSAAHLPALFVGSLAKVVRDIPGRAARADPFNRTLTWLGVPVLAGLMLWGSRRLRAQGRVTAGSANLAANLDAVSRALPAAIPAAAWLFVALSLGMPRQTLIPVLALLSLWPMIVFVSRLSRLALLGRLADAERVSAREAVRLRSFQRVRLGLWVAGALGLIYLLTHALPLAPLLADLLDRLAMLGLIAMVFPALALRDLVSHTSAHIPSSRSRALRFLAPLSRILPVFVVVTGLIGLVGFNNLAWELTGYFLWLLLVGLALYFVAGLLADLKARLSVRLDRIDPQRAVFWRTHFLDPGHRLALLGAFAGGGWMLFGFWGWNAQTPAVLWAKGLVDTVLFRYRRGPLHHRRPGHLAGVGGGRAVDRRLEPAGQLPARLPQDTRPGSASGTGHLHPVCGDRRRCPARPQDHRIRPDHLNRVRRQPWRRHRFRHAEHRQQLHLRHPLAG
jgi:potassium efflux system protein